ncbi:MAG: DUF6428 family protein [Gemmataceae bacterium]
MNITLLELYTAIAQNPGEALHLMLPDGDFVPAHFHITEIGRIQKDFIDCGGTARSHTTCTLQVWVADDTDHRLDTSTFGAILELGKKLFANPSIEVELEYEPAGSRISQYPLDGLEVTPRGVLLHLGTKHTACLAPDRCGVPGTGTGANCC